MGGEIHLRRNSGTINTERWPTWEQQLSWTLAAKAVCPPLPPSTAEPVVGRLTRRLLDGDCNDQANNLKVR